LIWGLDVFFFFGLEIWDTSRCSSTFAVLPKPQKTSEEGLVPLGPQHPEELVEQVPFGLRRLGRAESFGGDHMVQQHPGWIQRGKDHLLAIYKARGGYLQLDEWSAVTLAEVG